MNTHGSARLLELASKLCVCQSGGFEIRVGREFARVEGNDIKGTGNVVVTPVPYQPGVLCEKLARARGVAAS
jgi:hypothetical protein